MNNNFNSDDYEKEHFVFCCIYFVHKHESSNPDEWRVFFKGPVTIGK
jgi:hypothetical protein